MEVNTNIKLDDVIGLEDAKEILKERLVDYFKFKDKLKYPPSKGILLYGYPGVGKTMLVNAVINELSNPNILFRIVEVSELTAHVGTTEKQITEYFSTLRNRAGNKHIVLLMDEVDQIIPKKTSQQAQGAIVSERIGSLLKELDGLESKNNNVFIVATTNHPSRIEEAFLRSGRIDDHIKVDLPTDEQRQKLIEKYLGHILGCNSNNRVSAILKNTSKWTGADYKKLGGKLELTYLKKLEEDPNYQLDAFEIFNIVSFVNKQRKLNFKMFEQEYKKYMNAP